MREFLTIDGECEAEIEIKKSRFIAHLAHVDTEEDALNHIERIRHENTSARHNVYAYILSDGRCRYSDDGEPAKTAGMPTLDALKHANIENVACVTTRYFGGTLLGTGGLVRAYTGAVDAAIQTATIVKMSVIRRITLKIAYAVYDALVRTLPDFDAKIEKSNYSDFVDLSVLCKDEVADALITAITEISHGQAEINAGVPFEGTL